MTKTTNFEISKKLAEIGFEAETSTSISMLETKDYPSYDLETLLDALPKAFGVMQEIYETGFHLNIDLNENAQTFSYIEDGLLSLQEHHEEAFVIKTQEESLADTAGRMIILLHEKNLIKF